LKTCEKCGARMAAHNNRALCGTCLRQCATCSFRYDPREFPGTYCPSCTAARAGRQHRPHCRGLASDERIAELAARAETESPLWDKRREDRCDD
jgi:hypothetical protein